MRLGLASLFVLALTAQILAGTATVTAVQDASAKILRINWGDPWPETLDPQQSDLGQWGVSGGIDYEGLTRLNEDLEPVPGAAESWEFNNDGTAITFNLREGLVFSDGVPIIAEHFRYAAERLCSPELNARSSIQHFDIVGCEELFNTSDNAAAAAARTELGVRVIDDRTLEYRFDRPAPYFVNSTATQWGAIPLRQELVEVGGETWWTDPATRIGNGPFKLVTYEDQEPDQILTYARNDHYWGGPAKLDAIEFLFFDLASEENLTLYESGELDMTWPVNELFPLLETDPILSRELIQIPVPGTSYWGFDVTREPFTDKKVREAFAYAFDRESYKQQMCHGACQTTLSWIAPGTPGHIETGDFAFNPVKAREALAASSYGGPEHLPPIDWYSVAGDADDAAEAAWFSAMYREVLGIEFNVIELPESEYDALFEESIENWPQFVEMNWWSGPDPRTWFVVWRCGSPMNQGYCNSELDALLDRADVELDPETRLALYKEAGHMLVADVPAVFVFNASFTMLIKPYVTGYSPTTPTQHWPGFESLLTIEVNRPE